MELRVLTSHPRAIPPVLGAPRPWRHGVEAENTPGVLPKTLVRQAGGAQELAFLTSSRVRPRCWPAGRAWGTTVVIWRVRATPHEPRPGPGGEQAAQCSREEGRRAG